MRPTLTKVPVEASRLGNRVLPSLRHERRHVVVKVEEEHEEKTEGDGGGDPESLQLPERDEPAAIRAGEERPRDREEAQASRGDLSGAK